jgi:ferredoxin
LQNINRIIMGKVLRDYEVYLVYVDPERCDSCKECILMCPTDVFEMPHKAVPVCKSKAVIITEI